MVSLMSWVVYHQVFDASNFEGIEMTSKNNLDSINTVYFAFESPSAFVLTQPRTTSMSRISISFRPLALRLSWSRERIRRTVKHQRSLKFRHLEKISAPMNRKVFLRWLLDVCWQIFRRLLRLNATDVLSSKETCMPSWKSARSRPAPARNACSQALLYCDFIGAIVSCSWSCRIYVFCLGAAADVNWSLKHRTVSDRCLGIASTRGARRSYVGKWGCKGNDSYIITGVRKMGAGLSFAHVRGDPEAPCPINLPYIIVATTVDVTGHPHV